MIYDNIRLENLNTMGQKGKIRELQEDLRISRQTVKGLSQYCEKYKKRIKELEELLKKLNTHTVNGFYYLQDGDEVKNGDEYYDYDDGCEWKLIDYITEPQEFNQEEEYQVRRKVFK